MQFRHFIVSGRVQGVSFRAFTSKRAIALGLTGWVRNLSDGRVEILATGPDDRMSDFEAAISRGPILARVDHIEKKTAEALLPYTGFRIKADGEGTWPDEH
jgi:acylphosphatase